MIEERSTPVPATVAGFISRAADHVAEALKYWEPRRLVYNAVLAVVVIGHIVGGGPDARARLNANLFLGLFFLAVLANVCYCAVYAVDFFVRFSGLTEAWARWRVALLAIGCAFGAVIAHFISMNIAGGA